MTTGYSASIIQQNSEANKSRLGVRLGRACIKRNIPVSTVASSLGVSRQTIYNWFIGASDPLNIMVATIKQFLASLNK
jgi:transcriptional regulator with XRE-family HTH domain